MNTIGCVPVSSRAWNHRPSEANENGNCRLYIFRMGTEANGNGNCIDFGANVLWQHRMPVQKQMDVVKIVRKATDDPSAFVGVLEMHVCNIPESCGTNCY